jgi:hypothetical protein
VGASSKRHSRQPRGADSRSATGAKLGPVCRREGEPADLGVTGRPGRSNRAHPRWGALPFMGRLSSRGAGRAVVGLAVPRRAAASTRLRRAGMGLTSSGRRRCSTEPRTGLERTCTRCSGPTTGHTARATCGTGGPCLGITIARGPSAAGRFARCAILGYARRTGCTRSTASAFGSVVGVSLT